MVNVTSVYPEKFGGHYFGNFGNFKILFLMKIITKIDERLVTLATSAFSASTSPFSFSSASY